MPPAVVTADGRVIVDPKNPTPVDLWTDYRVAQSDTPNVTVQYSVVVGKENEAMCLLEELVSQNTSGVLIVMGMHRRTGLSRLYLGNRAEEIVRSASCSVLVVKQPASSSENPRSSGSAFLENLCTCPFGSLLSAVGVVAVSRMRPGWKSRVGVPRLPVPIALSERWSADADSADVAAGRPHAEPNEAEQLFRQMDAKVMKAKSVGCTFETHIDTAGVSGQNSMKGTLLIAEGNKFRSDAKSIVADKMDTVMMVADGNKMVLRSGRISLKPEEVPKRFGEAVRASFIRCGLLAPLLIMAKAGAMSSRPMTSTESLISNWEEGNGWPRRSNSLSSTP